MHLADQRQGGDSDEHDDRQGPHDAQGRGCVAALGLLEARHTVADRLHPRQGRAARGEGTQDQRHQQQATGLLLRSYADRCGLRNGGMTAGHLQQPERDHREHTQDEAVGGDREELARLLGAAQVHQRQERNQPDGQKYDMGCQRWDCRDDVRHTGGHRHRDGQHVVDQQRARGDQSGIAAQVGPAHRVRSAASGIGVAGLAVGQHHHHQQQYDGARDPGRKVQQRQPPQAEHQQDLFGGVRVGRQRVAAEDREGQLLGQQRLPQHRAAKGTSDQQAFGKVGKRAHQTRQTPRRTAGRPS